MLRKSHTIVSEMLVASLGLLTHQSLSSIAIISLGAYIGVRLPDIDQSNSRVNRNSKFIHFFTKRLTHRTWTHTIWAVIVMALLAIFLPIPKESQISIFNPLLSYYLSVAPIRMLYIGVATGYFLHIFEDSFSHQGICWFYPFSKFRYYNHRPYKIRHKHFWYYQTGGKEETWIRRLSFILLCVAYYFILIKS